ncbi:MAG: O-antigen ligase family protein [Candidatus Sumerlaeaceae bacterium]|nr:O-antigen ligase family protein [Candidatus Sumerlaeaceae bacterium]
MALLTALILAYCLISALNARATYDWSTGSLIYRDCLRWLPHSYDAPSTWRAFWNYLALAAFFWSLRDWLLGRTATEARNFQLTSSDLCPPSSVLRPSPSTLLPPSSLAREVASPTSPGRPSSFVIRHSSFSLPSRLRWLLWLLSLNGALLAVEGIAQRLSGTNKLLWFMPTRLNREALSQFGPYAYRSNGAQYLNLIWPVALGFWWHLRHEARRRRTATARRSAWLHHLLLPCILVTAAAPIISTSRAGAIVAIVLVLLAGGLLMFAMRRRHPLTRFFTVLFLCAVFAVGAYVGGDQLLERMGEFEVNFAGREASYDMARDMARDYLLFGIGPGAFAPMFQFYRSSLDDYWPAQLHNDWLETRITFGWFGCALIALAFLANQARAFLPGGLAIRWPLAAFIWLALAGCLLHARWDFPFQIYSILGLFVILCAVLSSFSVRPTAAP